MVEMELDEVVPSSAHRDEISRIEIDLDRVAIVDDPVR
jgi:hypothetical protein